MSEENPVHSARPKYLRSFSEYARLYGRSPRQLMRWLQDRESDWPPLDSPALMAGWWQRNFQIRVPGQILAFAIGRPPESSSSSSSSSSSDSLPMAAVAQSPQARLEWLQKTLPIVQRRYSEAVESGDHNRVAFYQRTLNPLLEETRQLEQSIEKENSEKDLSPTERRALLQQKAELENQLRANREALSRHMLRRIAIASGRSETLAALRRKLSELRYEVTAQKEAAKADANANAEANADQVLSVIKQIEEIDGSLPDAIVPGFTRLENELAQAAVGVFGGWLESQEQIFAQFTVAGETLDPGNWNRSIEILEIVPKHLLGKLAQDIAASVEEEPPK